MSAVTSWFLLGVMFFLIELFSPVFITLFFGFGAWAAGLATLLGAGFAPALTVFIVVSIASLFFLRRLLLRSLRSPDRWPPTEADKGRKTYNPPDDLSSSLLLTGKSATVSRIIMPQAVGEVSVGGSFWRAVADVKLVEGTVVTILGHDPDDQLLLRVAPPENVHTEISPGQDKGHI